VRRCVAPAGRGIRVRVEIMGSQKSGIVGEIQSVFDMINPILFVRIRTREACMRRNVDWVGGAVVLTGTQTAATGR
jgi:hypothetical protein